MRLPYAAIATLALNGVAAQCPFDPTVVPNNLVLCPNSQDTLGTQVYDSYQWYKDGVAIAGATAQTLIVDAFLDAGSMFSVEGTLAGCTEMSPAVLVDGWAFLLPYVISDGDAPMYVDGFGTAHHCPGDTVLLILGLPYDTLIQWTDGGTPIAGATNDTLVVTGSGVYSASGAPSLCPGFIQALGVSVGIEFEASVQPLIVTSGSQICASPTGTSYQWYLNGAAIPGGNTECIEPVDPGSYVVEVDYGDSTCTVPSAPWLGTAISVPTAPVPPIAGPVPAGDHVRISGLPVDAIGQRWALHDATGRRVRSGTLADRTLRIDLAALPAGRYWFSMPEHGVLQPIPVTIVR